jgi:ADP-ribose pyrophosphatase YjhB (NUDIX family)
MKLIGFVKSKTRKKILRFFFLNRDKKYYLRELERILSLPVGNIRRELVALEKLGLFNREKKGNLVYYSLNENSPILESIEKIVLKETNKKKGEGIKYKFKKAKKADLMVIKEKDLDLLFSKIGELENILKTLLDKESQIEDFINLGVVRNRRGEILLIKRGKKEKGRNKSTLSWAFPGGRQRLNEAREECVAREILTKTGYKVKSIKEISFRPHPQFPIFIVYHLCKLVSPKRLVILKEPHEAVEVRWVKSKDIKKLFTTNFDLKVRHELGLR